MLAPKTLSEILDRGLYGADGEDAARLTEIRNIITDPERLGATTDEEVEALNVELNELADKILDGTADGIERFDTERLTEIAESVEALGGEAARRIEEAEKQEAQVKEIMARIRPPASASDEAEGSDEDDAEPGEDEAPAPAAADEEESEDDEDEVEPVKVEVEVEVDERVPVTASVPAPAPAPLVRPSLREIAARVPKQQRPAPASNRPAMALARTEHPFIRMLERGGPGTLDEVADLMAQKYRDFNGVRSAAGGIENVRIGRISIVDQYPEDRRLRSGENGANEAKVEQLLAAAGMRDSWTSEIVAAGGFCAPTPAVYDLEQLAGAHRPLRDSLPSFQADRGGIRFVRPPDLSAILVDQASGAIGEWTNATDLAPGQTTKTCQHVVCTDAVEVITKAIYSCLGFGNFGARAFPEAVRAWTLNAAAAFARKAEQEILDSVSAASTAVTSTGLYGYVSELLTHILQLSYGVRSRQRMMQNTRLRLWLPDWVPAQMQIDVLRQGGVLTRVVPEAEIRAMFDAANVNVTFYADSRTGAGQIVGAQAAAELRDLPELVEWYLFHEGAFVHLTGGELDLGVVRDSTLNATNDFQVFFEEWAEVAYRGMFSYRVRDTLCPSGDRQVPIDGDPCGAS